MPVLPNREVQDLKAWYANANAIARFLHSLNPANWPLDALRMMMHRHLDLTLTEASDYLAGSFWKSIRDFQAVENEILVMADQLSDGVIMQLPGRF
jgi:hypothetical protein